MIPPKYWHSQTFHPILKSQQPLQRVLKFCLYYIYFHVNKCFGLGLGFTNMDLTISATLGFYHLTPLLTGKFSQKTLMLFRKTIMGINKFTFLSIFH